MTAPSQTTSPATVQAAIIDLAHLWDEAYKRATRSDMTQTLASQLSNTVQAKELTADDTIKRVNRYIDSLHPDMNQFGRVRARHDAINEYVSAIAITLATHLAILTYNENDLTEQYDAAAVDRYERYLHSIPQRYVAALKAAVPQSLRQYYGRLYGTVSRRPLRMAKCLPPYLSYAYDFTDHALAIFLDALEDMRNPSEVEL